MIIAYEGTNYSGFQRQNNALGIQEVIEKCLFIMLNQIVLITPSGRTDKGVHALAQVIHFDTSVELDVATWKRALNYHLPGDIRVLDVVEVTMDFHARYSAQSKKYEYKIAKQASSAFSFHYENYYFNIDYDKMIIASKELIGTHDYRGFCKVAPDKRQPTIRTIYDVIHRETNEHHIFTFHGNGFLKYMIRSMMGTLVDIGLGKKEIHTITKILETKNRALAGKTIQACGLYLVEVIY